VNQESEQIEVDGMKNGADSTGNVRNNYRLITLEKQTKINMLDTPFQIIETGKTDTTHTKSSQSLNRSVYFAFALTHRLSTALLPYQKSQRVLFVTPHAIISCHRPHPNQFSDPFHSTVQFANRTD